MTWASLARSPLGLCLPDGRTLPSMNKSDILPGRDYAFRPSYRQHTPFERVRAIELVRGRWKVEWVEPNGLLGFEGATHPR